jgi:hypothetical protein
MRRRPIHPSNPVLAINTKSANTLTEIQKRGLDLADVAFEAPAVRGVLLKGAAEGDVQEMRVSVMAASK